MLIANFPNGIDEITVHGLTQWDKGQKLEIHCSDLPSSFQVHFANKASATATVVVGSASSGIGKVSIPDALLQESHQLYAWIYVTASGGVGETIKTVAMPIVARTKPTDYISTITPEQSTMLDQFMVGVNDRFAQRRNGIKRCYLYVDGSVSASGNGLTEESPFKTLCEAFDYVNDYNYTDVLIQFQTAGTYEAVCHDYDGTIRQIKDFALPVLHMKTKIINDDGYDPDDEEENYLVSNSIVYPNVHVIWGNATDDMAFYETHLKWRYITMDLRNTDKSFYFDGCDTSFSNVKFGSSNSASNNRDFRVKFNHCTGALSNCSFYRLRLSESTIKVTNFDIRNHALTDERDARSLEINFGSDVTIVGSNNVINNQFKTVSLSTTTTIKALIVISYSTVRFGNDSAVVFKNNTTQTNTKTNTLLPSLYSIYSILFGHGEDIYALRKGRDLGTTKLSKDASTGEYIQSTSKPQFYFGMVTRIMASGVKVCINQFNEQIPASLVADSEKAN